MDDSGDNKANWEPAYDMMRRPLWPYVKSTALYKCPSDNSVVQTSTGAKPRILTMSMNLYVGGFAPVLGIDPLPNGTDGNWGFARDFNVYSKMSQIVSPSSTFVFLDMREDRVNWSNFMTVMDGFPNDPSLYRLGDLPGMYHNAGCSFSFSDGHSEMRKWRDTRTVPPMGKIDPNADTFACPNNPDVAYLQSISTRPK